MLNNLPNPTIIAHRGSCAYAPENTISAFKLALDQGADAIELDVKLTRDKHIVVIHDQSVDRTTNGTGNIRDLNLADIRELDAGSFFDHQFKGEQVPTLDEVLTTVGRDTYLNIELTNYASLFDSLPKEVAREVKMQKIENRILFSSFNPIALIRIRNYLPESPIGLLALPGRNGSLARSWIGRMISYSSLNIEQSDADQRLIDQLHAEKKKVFAYTINEEEKLVDLFQMKIDGIFTDDPLLARKALNNLNIIQPR